MWCVRTWRAVEGGGGNKTLHETLGVVSWISYLDFPLLLFLKKKKNPLTAQVWSGFFF